MNVNVYSIFDGKSAAFSMPFYCINDAVATRSVRELADDPATQIGRHASDFSLYRLGTFDNETATFHNEVPPVLLGTAASIREVVNA